MQPPQVIASDLDGTLLGPHGELSDRTRKALVAAREYGLSVVAVTARTPYGVDQLSDLLPLLDAALCANGAIAYDLAARRVDVRGAIELDVARSVFAVLSEALPNGACAVETGFGQVGVRRHYADLVGANPRWEFVDSVDQILARAENIVKVKIYDPDLVSEEMIAAIDGADLGGLEMCHWGEFGMLEFNAAGTNKATGLAAWCDERGVGPESVVAFGDMPNDAPMLAWAGRSYAVAGAHPEAIAAATDVAESNADDGVARVVEAILEHARRGV